MHYTLNCHWRSLLLVYDREEVKFSTVLLRLVEYFRSRSTPLNVIQNLPSLSGWRNSTPS